MAQPGVSNAARMGLIVLGIALVGMAVYALAKWNGNTEKSDANKIAEKSGTTGSDTPRQITSLPETAPSTNPTTPGVKEVGTEPVQITQGATPGTTNPVQPVARNVTGDPTPGTTPPASNTTPSATTPTTSGTTPGATTPGTTPNITDGGVLSLVDEGDRALKDGKLIEARAKFSKALLHADATENDREALRTKLTTINQDLVFGPAVTPGDNLVESYKVQSGDALERIKKKRELATDWRLIQRVNKLSNPNAIRVGQTLKLVRGPFHAVVNKAAYRLDIFAGSPDDPANWLYIKSYKVGLGEGNSTPVGNYTIKKNSKLINPPWVNPRTGEKFAADNPQNPIGEYWIGWQGVGDSSTNQGYGFHGTIDPASIGQQKSMGCVRLGSTDVAELYELLTEEVTVVRILP